MLVAVMKEIPCTSQPFSNCYYKHMFEGNLNINEMLKGSGKGIQDEFPIKLFYAATAPLHLGQYDLVQRIGLQRSFFFQFIKR